MDLTGGPWPDHGSNPEVARHSKMLYCGMNDIN